MDEFQGMFNMYFTSGPFAYYLKFWVSSLTNLSLFGFEVPNNVDDLLFYFLVISIIFSR